MPQAGRAASNSLSRVSVYADDSPLNLCYRARGTDRGELIEAADVGGSPTHFFLVLAHVVFQCPSRCN